VKTFCFANSEVAELADKMQYGAKFRNYRNF
jgi:hypothetical protein